MPRIASPRTAAPSTSAPRRTAEPKLKLVAGNDKQRAELKQKQPLALELPPGKWKVDHSWGSDVRLLDAAGAHRKLPDRELSGTIRVALHSPADVLMLRNEKGQKASVHLVDPDAMKPAFWGPGGRAKLPPVVANRAGEEWH